MGGALGTGIELSSGKRGYLPETKLEAKMVEAMQNRGSEGKGTVMKSFNTIILKFPKIDQSFRKCKAIFQEFDEDHNGVIDHIELKHCLTKLDVSFSDQHIQDFFNACDINQHSGMKFNEFIVFLCLVFLLQDQDPNNQLKFNIRLPYLKATFETLVDAFAFLDKNKDGYVTKAEMIQAINETNTGERSSQPIALKRFEEMDWDKNGMVNFKEFLFAFTNWVGIDEAEAEDEDEDEDEGEGEVEENA